MRWLSFRPANVERFVCVSLLGFLLQMTAVLNTNMASLYAQKSLNTAQTELASSVRRLSSGQRITTTKDDAAGYALSEAIKATKAISDQSIRNAQNVISTIQVAEGALDAVGKILQRVLTLTAQRENSVLSEAQISSTNGEIASLLNEVQKIKERSKLQSSQDSVFGFSTDLMPGNSVTNISISDLSLLGIESQANYTLANNLLPAQTVYFNNTNRIVEVGGIITGAPAFEAKGPLITEVGDWYAKYETDPITHPLDPYSENPSVYYHVYVVSLTDVETSDPVNSVTPGHTYRMEIDSQLNYQGTIGYFQNRNGGEFNPSIDGGVITFTAPVPPEGQDPFNIAVGDSLSFHTQANFGGTRSQAISVDDTSLAHEGDKIYLNGALLQNAGTDVTVQKIIDSHVIVTNIGAGFTTNNPIPIEAGSQISFGEILILDPIPTGSLELVGNSTLDSEAAHDAGLIARSDYLDSSGNLISLDAAAVHYLSSDNVMNAIQNNATNRSDLGTWLNRLEYSIDNMQTLSTNLADGISRIVDSDYAAETSNLTRTQILQQAATSMLAQANQMPNVILTLLK